MKKKSMKWVICTLVLVMLLGLVHKEKAQAATAKIQSLVVVANKSGFRPSAGNYASIKASVTVSSANASLRIRVLNSKGKWIYQKTYTGIKSNKYFAIKWNGKAIKGNTAGLNVNQYPGTGVYTVEALAYYTSGGKKYYSKKLVKLPINYTAPGGVSGRTHLNYVPMFTGDKNTDYLAEVMCKAAGVTSTMSQDQKVKKIYHWITLNFKHVHYSMSNTSYKKYYSLSSLTSKVNAYRTSVNAKINAGTAIFTYYSSPHITWNMERRIGQCNNHAAVFKIMCNHMGVESEICKGYYLNRNGTRMGHYWNSAVINGVTYYYDVDVELQNLGKGQGDYYWYKKTRTEAEKTHLFQ